MAVAAGAMGDEGQGSEGVPRLPSVAQLVEAAAPPPPQQPLPALSFRRASAPTLGRRPALAEKRKSDVVPPAGSNIKEYCAVLTPFIYKLYCLVSDESTNDLCCWSERGDAFLVKDPTAFAASVLPNYFKHNQFSSFVRQLNKYRFHKLAPGLFLFGHDRFIRGRPDLLPDIGRQRSPERAPPPPSPAPPPPPPQQQQQPPAPYKRARRADDSDPVRAAVAAEASALRADIAALRADNAALARRVAALEDALAATRGAVDYLQHAAQRRGSALPPVFAPAPDRFLPPRSERAYGAPSRPPDSPAPRGAASSSSRREQR